MRQAKPRGNSSTRGRIAARGALLVALVASLMSLSAGSAAAVEHVILTGEYGKTGPKASGIGSGCKIAYHSTSKRLYFLSDSKIYGLEKTGKGSVVPLGGNFPIDFAPGANGCGGTEIEVDQTSGNIYAVKGTTMAYGYTPSGTPLGGAWPIDVAGQPGGNQNCGVAVTSSGEVWVGNDTRQQILKYTPAGAPAGSIDLGFNGCKAEVNRITGDLFVGAEFTDGEGSELNGHLVKFTAASGFTSSVDFGYVGYNTSLSANATENRVYVGTEYVGGVNAFNADTGALVETVSGSLMPGNSSVAKGTAIDEADGTLFTVSGFGDGGVIGEFEALNVPRPTTGDPTGNSEVSGTADPNEGDAITECYFEFGTTTSYGNVQPCSETLPIESAQTVHANLPNLVGSVTYHYRLVIGTGKPAFLKKGGDKTIVATNVQNLKSEPATEINRTTAKLNASFTGTDEATSYYFEYGTTLSYGFRTPLSPTELDVGPTTGLTQISGNVSGLEPDTTYHFRVIAKNSVGTQLGTDSVFKTPLAVDGIKAEEATDLTETSATLHGSFDGGTNDTPPGPLEDFYYYFEWGETTAYGNSTAAAPGVNAGAHDEIVHVSAPIAGLSKQVSDSTPYHFRLVVTNGTGTTYGPDRSFFTAASSPPTIAATAASDVSPTSARLSAAINPEGDHTAYLFQYGPTTDYGLSTPTSESIGDDSSSHPVSQVIQDLVPGTEYHFRVLAINFGGTSVGPDRTFTTPTVPSVDLTSVSAVTQTSARLSALVAGNASPTNAAFEYGLSSAYGSRTPDVFAGDSLLGRQISVDITGLEPGTTYHFRPLATNAVGTQSGADVTFTTQPASAGVAGPPPPPKKCKKRFVKRKGKCVRKKRRAKRTGHRSSPKTSRNG